MVNDLSDLSDRSIQTSRQGKGSIANPVLGPGAHFCRQNNAAPGSELLIVREMDPGIRPQSLPHRRLARKGAETSALLHDGWFRVGSEAELGLSVHS